MASWISRSLGQISFSITGAPALSMPIGSVVRSTCIFPAIAYATTSGGEAR